MEEQNRRNRRHLWYCRSPLHRLRSQLDIVSAEDEFQIVGPSEELWIGIVSKARKNKGINELFREPLQPGSPVEKWLERWVASFTLKSPSSWSREKRLTIVFAFSRGRASFKNCFGHGNSGLVSAARIVYSRPLGWSVKVASGLGHLLQKRSFASSRQSASPIFFAHTH